jgi:hypothetical protein
MKEKERLKIAEFIRNRTSLKGDECMKVERFLIDMQYKRKYDDGMSEVEAKLKKMSGLNRIKTGKW